MTKHPTRYPRTVWQLFPSNISRWIGLFVTEKWRNLSTPSWIEDCSRLVSPWAEELAYSAISCALLIILVVILYVFDNRPLSDWQGAISLGNYSVNISPNFIVSVLGTIIKSAVLVSIEAGLSQTKWIWFTLRKRSLLDYKRFDDASRGPLGSAKLLLAVTNIRFVVSRELPFLLPYTLYRDFASFGALLIIIGLVFDPFLQLLISYQGMLGDISGGSVLLARSSIYNGGDYSPSSHNRKIQNYTPQTIHALLIITVTDSYGNVFQHPHIGLHADMDAAIVQALDTGNDTLVHKPTYTCPTTNCTWPPFTSLAVCSHCTNITSNIQTTFIQNTTFLDNARATFHSPSLRHYLLVNSTQGPPPSESFEGEFLNQFPYPILENPIGKRLEIANYSSRILATYATADPNHTFSYVNSSNLLFSLQALHSTLPYIGNKTTWNSTTVEATECALYLCTNTYTSAVVNGTLVETINATASSRISNSYSLIPDQLMKNSSNKSFGALNITNRSDPALDNSSSVPAFQPYHIPRTDLSLSAPFGMSGTFNVTQATVDAIIGTLLEEFAAFTDNGSDPASLPANATNSFGSFSTQQNGMAIGSLVTINANGLANLANNAKAVGAVAATLFPGPQTHNSSAGLFPLNPYFDSLASAMTSVIRNTGDPAGFEAGTAQQWAVYIQVRWGVIAVPGFFVVSSLIFLASCIWRTHYMGLYPWKENPLPGLIMGLNVEARSRAKMRLEENGWREKTVDTICKDMTVVLKDQQRAELLQIEA